MISVQNLSKTYPGGVQALRSVNLTVPPVGMFGLLGVNGAGKTTLMRILAGLLKSDGGSAVVMGHNLATAAGKQALKAILGYLPQEFGLYPHLTVTEFLDYVAILKGITQPAERRRQVAQQIDRLNLAPVAGRTAKALSGGMKRRLGIAQALLGDPRLIIVDEPTAGVDPEERVRIRNLLGDVSAGAAVLHSTHIVEDIGHTCQAMAVMYAGQIIFQGQPADLIACAEGRVWHITSRDGTRPNGRLSIISTIQFSDRVQYRVMGEDVGGYDAAPAEPGLEDGYLWLMRTIREEPKL